MVFLFYFNLFIIRINKLFKNVLTRIIRNEIFESVPKISFSLKAIKSKQYIDKNPLHPLDKEKIIKLL